MIGLGPLAWLFVRRTPEACGLDVDGETTPRSPSSPVGDDATVPDPAGSTLGEALRTPAFWVFALASSVYGLVASGIALFNESILAERGFDPSTYHRTLVVTALTALVGNFGGGLLAERWSMKRLLVIAMALLGGTLAVLPRVTTQGHVMAYAIVMGVAGGFVMVIFFSFWGRAYGRVHLGPHPGSGADPHRPGLRGRAAGPRAMRGLHGLLCHGVLRARRGRRSARPRGRVGARARPRPGILALRGMTGPIVTAVPWNRVSPMSSHRRSFVVTLSASVSALALLAAAPAVHAEEVSVFAAASLTDALKEIAGAWETATGHKVVFNVGASNDLARQIKAGGPADVFFSADKAQMDGLEREGLVRAADRVDLLSNTLVVVVPADSQAKVTRAADLVPFKALALADPEAVPAGVYAREWLEAQGLWSRLENKVVPALNVRAALAAVESANADAGMVYKTDAAVSKRVKVVFEVPQGEGPAIAYPLAKVATSSKPAAAAFVKHLQSAEARAVFARFGFLALGGR